MVDLIEMSAENECAVNLPGVPAFHCESEGVFAVVRGAQSRIAVAGKAVYGEADRTSVYDQVGGAKSRLPLTSRRMADSSKAPRVRSAAIETRVLSAERTAARMVLRVSSMPCERIVRFWINMARDYDDLLANCHTETHIGPPSGFMSFRVI